ncbi:penicillin-binding protein 1C [Phaeobacter porticola]|uniref:peptidoglycan glycosyltransferase n=1 Tax=Phaeobacter porticola TaxID=1844006 RepID=A0A1L3I0B9_9RHOB|nr:penicillin-binding protein 1C [Phaeobacter porticola]APG45551.1 penicillin-binding protein 1C [Phaeobacter porticola]
MVLTAAVCAAVVVAGLVFDGWVARTPMPTTLAETATEVRDRNGQLLRAYPVGDGIWRMAITAGQVDSGYLAMLLRYEDKRFYDHSGVDLIALLRAAGQALLWRQVVSGGSTLTMQVARLLEDGSTGRWAGKLRQIRLALALERRLTKGQILELYLIHAPYGGNIEGVRAASYAWFGKEPSRLTPAQAALLVALPQAPEARRPDRAARHARAARDRVLRRMVDAGVLTAEDGATARHAGVPTEMRAFPQLAPHLADQVAAETPEQALIALTVEAGLQQRLSTLVAETAARQDARLSAAVVVADHQNGEILALVGSAGYRDDLRQGFVDMTRAARSPGSTLKPLIYGLAFDQGMAHPETMIHDGPIDIDGYEPQNFDGRFRGDVRVGQALQLSLNIPVVRLMQALGPARLMAALRRGGAQPQLPGGKAGLAVALGGVGLSLRDLVQVYAGLAAGGQGPRLRVRMDTTEERMPRLLSKVAAWQIADILRGLFPPPGAPAGVLAYKTGTSYGHRDTWAIGWDGRHVVGVWLGRADGTPVPGAFGAELAAPLLFEVFGRLGTGFAPLPPAPAATLRGSTADLPLPLQRFDSPGGYGSGPGGNSLQLAFPPDGAILILADDGQITLQIKGGAAPFLVLVNQRPVVMGARRRSIDVPAMEVGFSTLAVVDRNGMSDQVQIRITRPGG